MAKATSSNSTGFYNMRARWYDPQTGSFTTRDSEFIQTDHAYNYAGGDPINNSDPSGKNFGPYLIKRPLSAARAFGAFAEWLGIRADELDLPWLIAKIVTAAVGILSEWVGVGYKSCADFGNAYNKQWNHDHPKRRRNIDRGSCGIVILTHLILPWEPTVQFSTG